MESASDPFLARLHLYVDLKEQVLICEECGYVLASDRSQVTSHLHDKHHIDQRDRRSLTKHLNTQYPHWFRNPAEVPLRASGSDIHPRLAVHEGFVCCDYRTVNYHELTKHISQQHLGGRQATSWRIANLYDHVYLQTWTHGPSWQYWIAQKDGSTIRPVVGRGVSGHIQSVHQRERARAEEQERTHSMNTTAPTLAGTRPWMERTRWEITYQGFRRDILRSLTQMPWDSPWTKAEGIMTAAVARARREAAVVAAVTLKNCSSRRRQPKKKHIPITRSRLETIPPMSEVLTMVISSLVRAMTETIN